MKSSFSIRTLAFAVPLTLVSPVARAADPTTADCLAAHDNSFNLRNQHKLRAARSELLVCAAASCPTDVRNECTARVAEVNAAIPTIVFEAKDAQLNDLSEVKVTMDGALLVGHLEGTAMSIDPGAHSFVFEAKGLPPVEKRFVIVEGVKERRERVILGAVEPAKGTPPATVGSTEHWQAASTESGSYWNTQRILGWTATGLGVVGLTLGGVFLAQRSSSLSDRDAICPSGTDCPPGSQASIDSLTDDANSASTASTVSFVAGGVFIAGGVTMLLTAPRSAESARVAIAPSFSPNFRGVMLRHAW